MEGTDYHKYGSQLVLDIMKRTFGDYFKEYFDGEPINIPEYSLPCLIVTESSGTIESGATGTDVITETLTIMVVLNKKDYLGSDDGIDHSEVEVRNIIKGQDQTTGYPYEYMKKSVLYALRTNFTLDSTSNSNRINTEFGQSLRLNERGSEMATQEGFVTIEISRMALVPVRS